MNNTPNRRPWYRIPWLWALIGLALVAVTVVAIRPAISAAPEPAPVSIEQVLEQVQKVEQQSDAGDIIAAAANSDATQETDDNPTTLVADAPPADNCIACHTDEEKLKLLAEEPEEVHSEEASGEG